MDAERRQELRRVPYMLTGAEVLWLLDTADRADAAEERLRAVARAAVKMAASGAVISHARGCARQRGAIVGYPRDEACLCGVEELDIAVDALVALGKEAAPAAEGEA